MLVLVYAYVSLCVCVYISNVCTCVQKYVRVEEYICIYIYDKYAY